VVTEVPYDGAMNKRTNPFVLGVLGALFVGCSGAPAPVTVQSANVDGSPVASPSGATISVSAAYPATLFYALDAASGVRNRDPGYRAWIHDGDTPPAWLTAYTDARRRWTATTEDAGGGELVIERCARRSTTTADAVRCMKTVVPAEDHPVLDRAVAEADARVSAHYAAAAVRLEGMAHEMKRGLSSQDAAALFHTLRHEASLADDAPLRFEVVLVAKPPGAHSFAVQAGESLVHETGPEETSGSLLGVVFHEIAHLAHHQSPARRAMEEAFVALGDDGLFAAGLWDEVVATAFGNGLAAERFDPGFSPDRPMYSDPRVSALGAALYRRWRTDANVALGPALAEWIARAAHEVAPPAGRRIGDLMWSVIATSEERAPLDRFLRGVPYRSASRRRPLSLDLRADEPGMIAATRVTFATLDDLAHHPVLGEQFALPAKGALGGEAARVVRRKSEGPLELLVLASDAESLVRAAESLAKLPVPPR